MTSVSKTAFLSMSTRIVLAAAIIVLFWLKLANRG